MLFHHVVRLNEIVQQMDLTEAHYYAQLRNRPDFSQLYATRQAQRAFLGATVDHWFRTYGITR